MRVLHLSTTDLKGGAARGAYWLHRALIDHGVDSRMLVAAKYSTDATVLGPPATMKRTFLQALRAKSDALPLAFYHRPPTHALFSCALLPSWTPTVVDQLQPDIINLHWINDGFVRPETLRQYKRPIVWTLRDMWSFTGGCHYSYECRRYESECGVCPSLSSNRVNDYSRLLWRRKSNAWAEVDLTLVGLSTWIADCASKSSLMQNRRIEVIGNTLDFSVFKPIDKRVAREILNIDPEATLLTFGAINALTDPTKGFDYLTEAIAMLRLQMTDTNLQLLVFGADEPESAPDLGIPVTYLGVLHDDPTIALAYSAGDVTVVPSRQEALAKSAQESMACGRPVVCFDTTGVRDVVAHQESGYRAAAYDVEDLAAGMKWLLEDRKRLAEQSSNARQIVVSNFSPDKISRQYIDLYESLL